MDIKVSEVLGMHDLALRSWAEELFRLLSTKDDQSLVLDFSEIKFMSRSFAHEYLSAKKTFSKSIIEKNLNESVQQMLKLASVNPTKKLKHTNRSHIANL